MQDDAPISEQDAWPLIRDFLQRLRALFGGPTDIARPRTMPKRHALLLATWLSGLEALVRRLLLLAASRIPPPNLTVRLPTPMRDRKPSFPGRSGFASEHASDWHVTFKLHVAAQKKRTRSITRRPHLPPLYAPSCALAERFQALIRVAADPEPSIRRLARRMRADDRLAYKISRAKPKRHNPITPYIAQVTSIVWETVPGAWLAPGMGDTS